MSERDFSGRLRQWRMQRGLSQLALAGEADISQRHLSYLERGHSEPSREMVNRLARALNLPFRQHNALLLAAGFAPVWQQQDLSAPELVQVGRALDLMLEQQEPFPAVVVDRQWNLIKANHGAVRLVDFLAGPITPGAAINLADALVAPDVLRPHLANWPEVVRYFIRSVEDDAAADGNVETTTLLDRLLSYEGVRDVMAAPETSVDTVLPVLPMNFVKHGTSVSLFTAITTLGTPQHVTLQELRVESFFPHDAETDTLMRNWAA